MHPMRPGCESELMNILLRGCRGGTKQPSAFSHASYFSGYGWVHMTYSWQSRILILHTVLESEIKDHRCYVCPISFFPFILNALEVIFFHENCKIFEIIIY